MFHAVEQELAESIELGPWRSALLWEATWMTSMPNTGDKFRPTRRGLLVPIVGALSAHASARFCIN